MPTPSEQTAIDYYNRLYGVGNPVSAQILAGTGGVAPVQPSTPVSSSYADPLPPPSGSRPILPREVATETDVINQASRTAGSLELEAAQRQGSFEGVREQALEEVQGVRDLTRTAQGDVQSGQRVEDLRTASPLSALYRSLLPQVVQVGGDELTPLQEREMQTLRNEVVRGATREAMAEADSRSIPLAERAAFIQEESRRRMARRMNTMYRDMYGLAREEVMRENGLDPSSALPEGEVGTRLRLQAGERARQSFDIVTSTAFADDQQVELQGGAVFEPAREVAESRPLLMSAERVREGEATTGDYVRQTWHRMWRGRDDVTGEVTETMGSAAVRNLGLISRPITYPVFRAATWERDPTTGLPLDENDLNYRLNRWTSGVLSKLEADDGILANIAQYAMLLPAAVSGARNVDSEAISTGNVIRDFAIAHAQGEWEGSDIATLNSVQYLQRTQGGYWNWHDDIFGLGTGIAVPVGAVSSTARTGTRLTANAVAALADGARAERVADAARWIAMAADEGQSVSQVFRLKQFAKDVAEEGGFAGDMAGRLLDGAEAVGTRIRRVMSSDLAKRLGGVTDADDLRRVFPTLKPGSMLDNIVQESFVELKRIRDLADKSKRGLNDLRADPQGRRILHYLEEAWQATPSNAPPSVAIQSAMNSLIDDKLGMFIQKHVPEGWVFGGNGATLVKESVWLNHQDEINKVNSRLADATASSSREGTLFTYKHNDEVADLLERGLKGEQYGEHWRPIVRKIRNGERLGAAEYRTVNSIVRGEVVRDIIPSAVRSADYTAKLAEAATTGRELSRLIGAKSVYKGVRAFFGGKSDYSWVLEGTKKGGMFRPDPVVFAKNTPPNFRKWHQETINQLMEIQRNAEDLIRSAVQNSATRDEALAKVFANVSSGDVAQDYKEVLEIFWKDISKIPPAIMDKAIRGGGSKVTERGIRNAIASIRSSFGGDELAQLEVNALKVRRVTHLTDADDVDSLMAAWTAFRMKEQVWAKSLDELAEKVPSIFMRVPDSTQAQGRLTMLDQLLTANGVPASVFSKIKGNFSGIMRMADSDRRVLVNAVMKDLFEQGGLATGDDLGRISDAIQRGVAEIAGTDNALKGVATQHQSSFLGIRRVLQETVAANPSLGSVDDLVRQVYPAVLKAATDLDLNVIRSRFSAMGIKSSAGMRPALGLAPSFDDFGDIGRMFHDASMEDLLGRLQKPGQLKKVAEALKLHRPSDQKRNQWFLNMLDVTKRMTVTGLLGGFPLPNMRFMANNLLGHWMIAAVTSPGYIMTVMRNTPNALSQSFLRSAKRSGWLASDDVYDFQKARYVMKPDEVMFRTVDGEIWTKQMFDEAIQRNNLRYSQLSHEFQAQVFQDWVRASHMGPNGRSIRDYTKLPWSDETIPRGKFWEFLRPDKKNIWSMMGEEADLIQREAVFRAALKNGMEEGSAAVLARNSMLDYGAMRAGSGKEDVFLDMAHKNVAFFAFQYNMFRETAMAILRDGKAFRNMSRVGQMVNAGREDMEQWVLQDDSSKQRLFNSLGEEFREWNTINLGIQIPWMEHWMSMFFAGDQAMRFMVGNIANAEGVEETRIGAIPRMTGRLILEAAVSDPRLGNIIDWLNLEPNNKAPSGYMPSAFLHTFAAVGQLDTAVGFFGLEAVPVSEQRPDMPTFDGQQYRFKDTESRSRYLGFQQLLLMTGLERNLRDYVRSAIRLGIVPEGTEPRRDAEGHWVMYMLGGTTLSYPSAVRARTNIYEAQLKTLKEMSRQPTTRE